MAHPASSRFQPSALDRLLASIIRWISSGLRCGCRRVSRSHSSGVRVGEFFARWDKTNRRPSATKSFRRTFSVAATIRACRYNSDGISKVVFTSANLPYFWLSGKPDQFMWRICRQTQVLGNFSGPPRASAPRLAGVRWIVSNPACAWESEEFQHEEVKKMKMEDLAI